MSETTPIRTPSSVERMTSTTSKSSGGGLGGILTALLAVACIALIVACFYISSGKKELQTKIDTMMVDLNDTKATLAAKEQTVMTRERDIAALKGDLAKSIPLFRLPAAVQAPTVNEAIAKIQQFSEATPKAGGASPVPIAPGNDTPVAWMETIAKQVAKASINTKEPTGNDAAKVQMHKGIQIVLARVGAFPKSPTGNSQDTYDAVMTFQKAAGLKPDGIIGKGTWGKVREKFETVAGVHTN